MRSLLSIGLMATLVNCTLVDASSPFDAPQKPKPNAPTVMKNQLAKSEKDSENQRSHLTSADVLNQEALAYQYVLNLISERRLELAEKKILDLVERTKNETVKALLFYWLGELAVEQGDLKRAAQNFGAAYRFADPILKNPQGLESSISRSEILLKESSRLHEILLKLSDTLWKLGKKQDAKLALKEFNPKQPTLLSSQVWYYEALKKQFG